MKVNKSVEKEVTKKIQVPTDIESEGKPFGKNGGHVLIPKSWVGKTVRSTLITSILLAGILLSAAMFVYPAFAADEKVNTSLPATADKTGPQHEDDKDKKKQHDQLVKDKTNDNKGPDKNPKDNDNKAFKQSRCNISESDKQGNIISGPKKCKPHSEEQFEADQEACSGDDLSSEQSHICYHKMLCFHHKLPATECHGNKNNSVDSSTIKPVAISTTTTTKTMNVKQDIDSYVNYVMGLIL